MVYSSARHKRSSFVNSCEEEEMEVIFVSTAGWEVKTRVKQRDRKRGTVAMT